MKETGGNGRGGGDGREWGGEVKETGGKGG